MHVRRGTRAIAIASGVVAAGVLSLSSGSNAAKAPPPPAPAPLYPDVVEEVPTHLQVQNSQQRESLRFTTVHINLGPGNLQIRGGGQIAPCDDRRHLLRAVHGRHAGALDAAGEVVATHPAGVALFHPEHNHWHQSAVAEFEIMQGQPGARAAQVAQRQSRSRSASSTSSSSALTGVEKKALPRTLLRVQRRPPGAGRRLGRLLPPVDAAAGARHHRRCRPAPTT